jgi:predicted PurR-regulated permease PerM
MATPDQRAEPDPQSSQDSFVRRATTTIAIIIAAALLLSLFLLGIEIVLAAFAGLLIAVLLRALMSLLQRVVRLHDVLALGVVLVVLLAIVGGGAWLLAPKLIVQTEHLSQQFVVVAGDVQDYLAGRRWGQWVLARAQMQDGIPAGLGNTVLGVFTALSDWATYLLTAVFVGLFVAANTELYKNGLVQLFPLRRRALIRELLDDLGDTLRWFLIGQLLTMTVIGVSVMIVLWAFGIPLAVVIGLLVGILGFIPYLGPVFGVVPVLLVVLPEGPMRALYVMLAYAGVQTLEGYVAAPLIQQRTVYLPPALTVVMQILFGAVLGVLGFVLATPLTAVALVLARYYRREVLRDPKVEPTARASQSMAARSHRAAHGDRRGPASDIGEVDEVDDKVSHDRGA